MRGSRSVSCLAAFMLVLAGCGRNNRILVFNGVGPSITSVSPSSGPVAGGTSVTITGTNIVGAGGTTAAIGGVNITITGTTSNTITGITPPGIAGAQDVTVRSGLGTTTLPGGFTYVAPAP